MEFVSNDVKPNIISDFLLKIIFRRTSKLPPTRCSQGPIQCEETAYTYTLHQTKQNFQSRITTFNHVSDIKDAHPLHDQPQTDFPVPQRSESLPHCGGDPKEAIHTLGPLLHIQASRVQEEQPKYETA